ncbi:hypothetical protein OCK02_15105 [Rhizobium sp. TRM96647]|uniref:hypothetical protein n=1 Tax=unclassified Rhizobium TaxID=2613769 RepID=UPI0021E9AB69|nr:MULTISPECIES: hypothetical protein [unclassified Rhizobium]MCV3737543.1 hypothetical protein [Rhizobium sp. TRM96647]MCV3756367.1 hypothetical protein [Rhizobium sp. TRM96650]
MVKRTGSYLGGSTQWQLTATSPGALADKKKQKRSQKKVLQGVLVSFGVSISRLESSLEIAAKGQFGVKFYALDVSSRCDFLRKIIRKDAERLCCSRNLHKAVELYERMLRQQFGVNKW